MDLPVPKSLTPAGTEGASEVSASAGRRSLGERREGSSSPKAHAATLLQAWILEQKAGWVEDFS